MESNETDDIEMEGAVEEETMEGKEGEVATKVQGAKLLLHHPSPQVEELQRVERELGRQLSSWCTSTRVCHGLPSISVGPA